MTKSSEDASSLRVLDSPYGDVSIVEYAEDFVQFRSAQQTKGRIVSSDNISSIRKSFIVDGFLNSQPAEGDSHFINGQTCAYDAGAWGWIGGETPRWRNGTDVTLWSYSTRYHDDSANDNVDVSIDESDPEVMHIHYTHPSGGCVDEGSFFRTNDVIIAYNKEKRDFDRNGRITGGKTNEFTVNFQHALAAVKFELPSGNLNSGVGISRIILSGFAGSGDCTATGSGNGSGMVDFDWTPGEDRSRTFVEVASRSDIESGKLSGGQALFMIPQNLSGVKLTISFVRDGYEVNRTVRLGDASWEAGKCYTYRIKATVHFPGEVININSSFNIKGFAKSGGIRSVGPVEVIGVKKLAVFIDQTYKENSGHGTAEYYLGASDGTWKTKGTSLEYDFLPVGSLSSIPYDGGDGVPEKYNGAHSLGGLISGSEWGVYDVAGHDSFYIICQSRSSSNDGQWSGTLQRAVVLEVVNDDISELLANGL